MTRLGMVVLGLTAAATAIALAVGLAVAPSQETTPAAGLTPAQMAELKSAPPPGLARTASVQSQPAAVAVVVA